MYQQSLSRHHYDHIGMDFGYLRKLYTGEIEAFRLSLRAKRVGTVLLVVLPYI